MKRVYYTLLLVLAACAIFGQAAIRRADTLAQVLAINPTNVAAADKVTYLTFGRNTVGDGDSLLINYDRTNNLATNDTTRFATLASTGRWIVTSITPYSGPGLTNFFTFSAGTNMEVTVTSNSVTYAMTNTTFSGSGGSAISFNGTNVTNVNIADTHIIKWAGTGSNYVAYATNYFYWEGVPVWGPTLRDSVYVTWSQSGSNLTPTVALESLDPTRWEHLNWPTLMGRYSASIGDIEYITVGANLNLDSSSGVLSAVIPPGTNSYQISVDDVLVVTPNLADSSELNPTATGTNITYALVSESIATNKINTTFQNLLLNQYRVNNLTNWFLSLTNNVTDTGRVMWRTNSNGDWEAYATNLPAAGGSGLGTNVFVNGVLIQPAYFTNSAEVFIATNANGHIVFDVNTWDGFWSDLTNSLVASNNISFAYDTGANKLLISAITSGGTGTAVTVDGGTDLTRANFADASTTGLFDISGTNITIRLPDRDFGSITVSSSGATMTLDDGTVTSNKIVAANVTIDKLSATGTPLSTNFLAGDYSWKQVTTNMVPGLVQDILNAASTGGGGGGGGTNILVNGTLVNGANLTNSSTVLWSVDGTNITATVTNVAGATTQNVVQKIGGVLFYYTGGAASNESYAGIATNLVVNAGSGAVPLQATVSLSGAPSTNYVVHIEPYDTNSVYSGSSMAYSIRDKTTAGFQFTAEYNGAALDAVWYRIWILDTVSVAGSGGDVISTNNNEFTATNTFNGPIVFGGGFTTTNLFAPHRQKVILHENEYVLGNSISSGDIGLPSLSAAAIASGTISVSQTSASQHQGLLRVSSASGANSGFYALSSVGSMFSEVGLTWESITRPLNTNAGARVYLGFQDSTSAGAATDGIHLFRSNNIIIPQVYYNGTLTQGSEYTISSNQFLRTKIAVTAANAARFVVVDSDTGTAILDETITTTLPDSTSRLFGVGWKGFYTNAAAAVLEDFDWTAAYYDRPISR